MNSTDLILTLLIIILIAACETLAGGKNFTWTGGTTDWYTAANWEPIGPPSLDDAAIIPTGLNYYPIITNGTVNVKDVKIDGTGTLTISDGVFNVTRKIEFSKSTSPYGSIIQLGGTINVKDLRFKGAGTFTQSGSSMLTVSHDYKNSSGGTFNSIGGTIQFTGTADGQSDFSTGTNQFYNVIVNSGVNPKFDNANNNKIYIAGNFTNNNSSLDVSRAEFTFNGNGNQDLFSNSSPANQSSTFGTMIIDKSSGLARLVTDIGVENTIILTQGQLELNSNLLYEQGEIYNGPLPVELTSFTASVTGNSVKLNWRTETEVDNYGFYVERNAVSLNIYWEQIGFIEGYGNSNSPKEYSFTDNSLIGGEYSYRLKQIDNDGDFEYSDEISITIGAPNNFSLKQNYPNPFNPSTTISFSLPQNAFITLKIFNLMGEEVETLVNSNLTAGNYNIKFNPSELASGVYIYHLSSNNFSQTRKMQYLK